MKLISFKNWINEKFTKEDSDPIDDMNIGYGFLKNIKKGTIFTNKNDVYYEHEKGGLDKYYKILTKENNFDSWSDVGRYFVVEGIIEKGETYFILRLRLFDRKEDAIKYSENKLKTPEYVPFILQIEYNLWKKYYEIIK